MEEAAVDDHSRRIVERATVNIGTIIDQYRREELGFGRMVDSIEVQIGSMAEQADSEWLEEWRSNWNQLEYVHAVMLEDGRESLTSDEREVVEDTLDALKRMSRP